MSFAYCEDECLRVVWDEAEGGDDLLHIPIDAEAELETETLTSCGLWGPASLYVADSYELDAADFCPACAASQELERLAIAAAKSYSRAEHGEGPGRMLSDSPDFLYAAEMDPAERAYWTAITDQINAADRDAPEGERPGLLGWLNQRIAELGEE